MIKPVVYAHRGASGYKIENTIPSFELAIDMHADAVEFDVQLTADDDVVVFHDFTLTRLFNVNASISDLTTKEIKKYTLKDPVDGRTVDIPLLGELLERISHRILMNIELKSRDNDPEYIEKLCNKVYTLVNSYNIIKDVVVSSFNIQTIKQMRKLSDDIKIALLVDKLSDEYNNGDSLTFYIQQAEELNAEAINMSYLMVNDKIIETIHNNGFRVNVYTVNNESLVLDLLKNGIDGIFTNYPDKVIQTIELLENQKNMP
ncbi:MAG: glycerophosphodiester phosphodiesterase [bacterium]